MGRLKNENGSVTLFTLVSCLFFIASVACVSIYMQSKQTAVDREYRQIKANYEVSIDELKKSGEILSKNMSLFDDNNVLITIPAGFKISVDSPTVALDGIIIEDEDGNQFVWIPINEDLTVVGTNKEMAKESTAENFAGKDVNGRTNYEGVLYNFTGEESAEMTSSSTNGQGTEGYREPDSDICYDGVYGDNMFLPNLQEWLVDEVYRYKDYDTFKKTLQEDYNEMIDSVKTYGGFYVGRYEMGAEDVIENKMPSGKPTSKIGPVTNALNWFVSRQWYGLYSKAKTYTNKKNSVKSSMIWGSQYDAMLNYALIGDDKEKVNAIGYGNHNGSELDTGATQNDKIINIFDLEGNHTEWTLEANTHDYRVTRGGYYNDTREFSPSSRINRNCDGTETGLATRLTLYIKDDEITTLSGVQEYGILDRTVTIKDSEKQLITIPKGFTITKDSGTKVSEGVVITDSVDENGNSTGNEFVWVPKGELYQEIKESGVGKYWSTGKDIDGTAYTSKQSSYSGGTWTDDGGNEDSVKKYGGFYIARYEAGLPSEIWTKDSTEYKWTNGQSAGSLSGNRNTGITNYKPVSKKNNPSWNRILQANAITVSNNMYNSSTSVTSSLIDNYAWDTVEEWIKESGKTITNSTSYGNYMDSVIDVNGLYAVHKFSFKTGENTWKSYASAYSSGPYQTTKRSKTDEQDLIEIATGSSENTKTNNIYDLAGNLWEWTTESGTNSSKEASIGVIRGGSFVDFGSAGTVCYRNGTTKSDLISYNIRLPCGIIFENKLN